MATNFFELATTLKYLGAKWLPGKKVNFTPCSVITCYVPFAHNSCILIFHLPANLSARQAKTTPRFLQIEGVSILSLVP